ncbi:sulfite exporter TauE/SafE family protein [Afifella pfennigii]|uniref:sulfite exporter TauE/SafE family protein n=1 Tax=Afifella pfennigii TaxID=209897 RepID=UPI000553DAA8|nr:sulfite exporter TauE/SafE family protein [Afifella pfennigii]
MATAILLFAAGIVGGAANAIAGGGTFFTFPALMAAGLDPLTANVSNAVAIYPGHAAAVPAYRQELVRCRSDLLPRSLVAAAGGLAGALVLLWAGNRVFTSLVPWLLLAATLIFAAGPLIGQARARLRSSSAVPARMVEFLFAVYGGYFGAGLGVLMMAALSIVGVRDVQVANAQKNLLATIITTISVATFIVAGVVAWPHTLTVLAGAAIGGYLGARTARHIPAPALRLVVVATGLSLSLYYFLV